MWIKILHYLLLLFNEIIIYFLHEYVLYPLYKFLCKCSEIIVVTMKIDHFYFTQFDFKCFNIFNNVYEENFVYI